MNTLLWTTQILLALLFAAAGLLKLTQPLEVLNAKVGGWVHDVPLVLIRTVGALEIAGAVGLILPAALHVLPMLTGLAAAGLAATMAGAIVVHGRRGEHREAAVNVALAIVTAAVAWARLGPHGL